MLELAIALFYGAAGALLYRIFEDRKIRQITLRLVLGLASGVILFALLRTVALVRPGDAMALYELLLLVLGGLLVGFATAMTQQDRAGQFITDLLHRARERVRIRFPFPSP